MSSRDASGEGSTTTAYGSSTSGDLRHEVNGSTDMAAWHPLDDVTGLTRVRMVDLGLALWRERPATGRSGGDEDLGYPGR
jgi:hypothetical protein